MMIVKVKDKEYSFDGYTKPLQSIQQLAEECYKQGRMSDITMDCDKCQEFQNMKGRAESIHELKELLPDCDKIEIEHLICLMEKVVPCEERRRDYENISNR